MYYLVEHAADLQLNSDLPDACAHRTVPGAPALHHYHEEINTNLLKRNDNSVP